MHIHKVSQFITIRSPIIQNGLLELDDFLNYSSMKYTIKFYVVFYSNIKLNAILIYFSVVLEPYPIGINNMVFNSRARNMTVVSALGNFKFP